MSVRIVNAPFGAMDSLSRLGPAAEGAKVVAVDESPAGAGDSGLICIRPSSPQREAETIRLITETGGADYGKLLLQHDKPVGDGELGQAGDGVDVQTAHDAFAVGLDGTNADAELMGDLLVALALGDQHQDLALTARGLGKGALLAPAVYELKKGSPSKTDSLAWSSSSGGASLDT